MWAVMRASRSRGLSRSSSVTSRCRAPAIPVLLDLFEDAVAQGHGQDDHASVQEMFLEH